MKTIRFAVVWLLAVALPVQLLTAIYLDLRGPLHFHVEIDDDRDDHDEHADAHAHEHAHPHVHAHAHAHAHDTQHPERHHHEPADASVVTVDTGLLDQGVLEAETKSGWSSVMLAAVLTENPSLDLADLSSVMSARPQPFLQTRSPGRLERPPRTRRV